MVLSAFIFIFFSGANYNVIILKILLITHIKIIIIGIFIICIFFIKIILNHHRHIRV